MNLVSCMQIKAQFDMQRYNIFKVIILGLILFFIQGCGRKQKSILCFQPEPKVVINKLDLPSVKGMRAQITKMGVYISWLPIFTEKTSINVKKLEKNFMGYDIFRLANNATFIPKKPINKKPVSLNYYIDSGAKKIPHPFYLVQPIFKFDQKIIRGPSSHIISPN
jgi:hypothetical protein